MDFSWSSFDGMDDPPEYPRQRAAQAYNPAYEHLAGQMEAKNKTERKTVA